MCPPALVASLGLALVLAVSGLGAADAVDALMLDAVPERKVYHPPRYPAALAAAGAPVDVRLTLLVEPDGRVAAVENLEQAPRVEFAEAAREAVLRWRFSPGFVSGQPVRYRLPATVAFRADGYEGVLDTKPVDGQNAVTVSEPSVDWEEPPPYPPDLASNPKDGIAVINLMVDALGAPSDPVAEYASHAAFGAAACDAVMRWKFDPAERDGRLVSARTRVTVHFQKADAALTAADRKRQAQLAQSRDYDVAPEELIQAPLVYPYDALMKSERGTVSLNLFISPEGQVVRIEPEVASNPEFVAAASACVASWTFHPATKSGEPVYGWVKWQLVFADDSGELQLDDVSRELLAALRAGSFKSAPSRELDKPITPRQQVAPRLPPGLGASAAGDVLIEVIVDRNGRVQFPRVLAAPHPAVGYAAATSVLRWRFEPPRRAGEPVDVKVKIPFRITAPPPETPPPPG